LHYLSQSCEFRVLHAAVPALRPRAIPTLGASFTNLVLLWIARCELIKINTL
jgi:hypothetical protein